MAWALSCLQLRQFYDQVVFYGDDVSCELLIDKLRLPYTKTICDLNKLDGYHAELWALPKIHVYAQQEKPFLHVDGDVFIWKAFDQVLMNNGLIAQNLESATKYYESIMTELEEGLSYFPAEIRAERAGNTPILAYNAGIFGGHDISFFRAYTTKAFDFVHKNKEDLSKIRVTNFNIFFEQYLFYCLAKQQGKKVGVLFEQVIGDNEYKGFGDFYEVPYSKTYLHTLGTYKKSARVCRQLADRLRKDYPEYYYRIIDLYKNTNVDLKHDQYYFQPDFKQEAMVAHDRYLKAQFRAGTIPVKSERKIEFAEPGKGLEQMLETEDTKTDFQRLITGIQKIRDSRFVRLSREYLYARDLNAAGYAEELFTDMENIFSYQLIADSNIAFLQTRFDWSQIGEHSFLKGLRQSKPGRMFMAVVPECTPEGFSLAYADALDLELFELLKKPRSVGSLLNECKKMFDKNDYEQSKKEFQKLIFGRIKRGIFSKTIKLASARTYSGAKR